MANHSHRAGRLKQSNKKNKRSTASKRSAGRKAGAGKVQGSSSSNPGAAAATGKGPKAAISAADGRANRMNAAKQRRDASRKNKWDANRRLGGGAVYSSSSPSLAGSAAAADAPPLGPIAPPPRMVGIISLSEREGSLEELVRAALSDGAASVVVSSPASSSSSHSTTASTTSRRSSVVTVSYGKSSRIAVSLLTNSTSFRDQYAPAYGDDDASVQGALDLCRVCDLVLFVVDGKCVDDVIVGGGGSVSGASTTTTDTNNDRWDHLISERGERVLTAIKAQGLPTPVTVVVHPGGGGGGDYDDDDDDDHAGDRPIVGRRVGATADGDGDEDEDCAMMDDDDEDEEEEEVEMNDAGGASSFMRGGSATNPPRSARSIRKTRLRRRSELRRFRPGSAAGRN